MRVTKSAGGGVEGQGADAKDTGKTGMMLQPSLSLYHQPRIHVCMINVC